jgi:site-specific DNA-methyltransferase (adenine-specific)
MMTTVDLRLGDCLEIMPSLPMVNAIITDLPYGTTACAWDEIIPFAPMWEQVKRILKPRGVFVTTASQPFTSRLIVNNLKWFKYSMIWDKSIAGNPFIAKYQPLKTHEDVCVFSRNRHTYNPQMRTGKMIIKGGGYSKLWGVSCTKKMNDQYFPTTILSFTNGDRTREEITDHPTQKPVSLYSYLILTYTNPGDTVLDICAGSGTTGVAAILTGRNAILIEKDPAYFAIMERRIHDTQQQPNLFET